MSLAKKYSRIETEFLGEKVQRWSSQKTAKLNYAERIATYIPTYQTNCQTCVQLWPSSTVHTSIPRQEVPCKHRLTYP